MCSSDLGIRVEGMGFADMAGTPWRAPSDLRAFPGEGFSDAVELVPGLAIRAVAAPGHSEGSTVFFLNADLAACDLLYEAEAVDVDPSLTNEELTYIHNEESLFPANIFSFLINSHLKSSVIL